MTFMVIDNSASLTVIAVGKEGYAREGFMELWKPPLIVRSQLNYGERKEREWRQRIREQLEQEQAERRRINRQEAANGRA
jgi:hypothetical protein